MDPNHPVHAPLLYLAQMLTIILYPTPYASHQSSNLKRTTNIPDSKQHSQGVRRHGVSSAADSQGRVGSPLCGSLHPDSVRRHGPGHKLGEGGPISMLHLCLPMVRHSIPEPSIPRLCQLPPSLRDRGRFVAAKPEGTRSRASPLHVRNVAWGSRRALTCRGALPAMHGFRGPDRHAQIKK